MVVTVASLTDLLSVMTQVPVDTSSLIHTYQRVRHQEEAEGQEAENSSWIFSWPGWLQANHRLLTSLWTPKWEQFKISFNDDKHQETNWEVLYHYIHTYVRMSMYTYERQLWLLKVYQRGPPLLPYQGSLSFLRQTWCYFIHRYNLGACSSIHCTVY